MAKGYVRSSHMSGNDPDCGTKLFRTPNPAGNIGSGPNHSQKLNSGHTAKAEHLPRAGEPFKFRNVTLPKNHGGDRVGKK